MPSTRQAYALPATHYAPAGSARNNPGARACLAFGVGGSGAHLRPNRLSSVQGPSVKCSHTATARPWSPDAPFMGLRMRIKASYNCEALTGDPAR